MTQEIIRYIAEIDSIELAGLVFGLLSVWFLIKQNILTWPSGIIYVILSLIIFWKVRLYGDFLLHILFLILNFYGWYNWKYGKDDEELKVTQLSNFELIRSLIFTSLGIVIFGFILSNSHQIWADLPPASLPYWDAATSVMSITGMWLTTQKKIESWYYWLAVDILATGIYAYKGIHFYALLYGVYVFLAVSGYRSWAKDL
jgi:nicotinamide mononucleotide transporter